MKLQSLPLRYRVLLFLMLVLVTVIALFFAIENWRGARAWAEMEDRTRALGRPLTVGELIPPMPPENENLAFAPPFADAIDFVPSVTKFGIRTNSELHAFNRRLSSILFRDDRPWATGEGVSVRDASKKPPVEQTYHETRVTTQWADGFLTDMHQWSNLFVQVEAAVERPYSRFPVRYEDTYGALLTHLAPIRNLAYAFSMKALAQTKLGDATAAAGNTVVAIKISNSVRQEPLIVSGFIRFNGLRASMLPIWEGMKDQQWTGEQLREFQDELGKVDLIRQLLAAYDYERIAAKSFMSSAIESGDRSALTAMFVDNTANPDDVVFSAFISRIAPTGWLKQNYVLVARSHLNVQGTIDLKSRTISPILVSEVENEFEDTVKGSPIYGRVARLIVPTFSVPRKFAEAQSLIDLARIACAVERHCIDFGQPPESLAALVPNYIDELPGDIFAGQPLRYSVSGTGYTLWAVGWNQSNEEGGGDDIVWRYPGPDTAEPSSSPNR